MGVFKQSVTGREDLFRAHIRKQISSIDTHVQSYEIIGVVGH
jgi:hypothetical protein